MGSWVCEKCCVWCTSCLFVPQELSAEADSAKEQQEWVRALQALRQAYLAFAVGLHKD